MSSAVGSGGSSASIAGNSTGSGSGSGALSGSGCDSAGCGPGASASASTSATGFSFHGSTPGSERTSGSVPDFVAAFTAAAGSRDPSKNAKTATAPVQASASAIAMIPVLSGTRATFRLSRLPLPPAPADHGQPGRGRDDTQYGQPEQGQPARVGQVAARIVHDISAVAVATHAGTIFDRYRIFRKERRNIEEVSSCICIDE